MDFYCHQVSRFIPLIVLAMHVSNKIRRHCMILFFCVQITTLIRHYWIHYVQEKPKGNYTMLNKLPRQLRYLFRIT
jgi:hypothetical protein